MQVRENNNKPEANLERRKREIPMPSHLSGVKLISIPLVLRWNTPMDSKPNAPIA
jgi:hypothetical protein